MFCPSCGKQFSDDFKVCPSCGTVVNGASGQAGTPGYNNEPMTQYAPDTSADIKTQYAPAQPQQAPQAQYAPPQPQQAPQAQYAPPQPQQAPQAQYAPAQPQYAPPQPQQPPQAQYAPPQQPYGAPPRPNLECNRSFGKILLLGFVTCGIYWIITYYKMAEDINTICRAYDGKTTQNYLVATLLLGSVTCGIYPHVWWHGFCNRIGDNLRNRGIACDFGASTYWLWNILGSMILVGPFIFMYKLVDATNKLAADFNARG